MSRERCLSWHTSYEQGKVFIVTYNLWAGKVFIVTYLLWAGKGVYRDIQPMSRKSIYRDIPPMSRERCLSWHTTYEQERYLSWHTSYKQGKVFFITHRLWHVASVYTILPEGSTCFAASYDKPGLPGYLIKPDPYNGPNQLKHLTRIQWLTCILSTNFMLLYKKNVMFATFRRPELVVVWKIGSENFF